MNKTLVLAATLPNHPEDHGPELLFIQLNQNTLERLKTRILTFQNHKKNDPDLTCHEHNDALLTAAFELGTNNELQRLWEKTTNQHEPHLISNDHLTPEQLQELSVEVDVITTATNEDSVFWQGYTDHSNATWESQPLTLEQINNLLKGAA